MGITSNLDSIRRDLEALGDGMRPTRQPKGKPRTVGGGMLNLTAAVIVHRTVDQQQDPQGAPLAPLSPVTLARKAKMGYPSTISVETGEMMSPGQVAGEQRVDDRSAEMTYGTGSEAKAKAGWFTEGNSRQPPREFFDLGRDGEELMDTYIEDEVLGPLIDELS